MLELAGGGVDAASELLAGEFGKPTLDPTLKAVAQNLADIGLAPTSEDRCDLVADKGYHSRGVLKRLDGDVWKSRISESKPANGVPPWYGDEDARKAVYANRSRLKSAVGRWQATIASWLPFFQEPADETRSDAADRDRVWHLVGASRFGSVVVVLQSRMIART